MADALSFTLIFPFKSASSEMIAMLPLTRLKRKDITAAQAVTKDEGAMEDLLVAKMLGITLEDLGEFDIADSSRATEVLREMAAGRDLAAVLGRSAVAGAAPATLRN
ncbi:phage tail assembly protein [Pseudomonas prosekii]|uniref:phage tail assembly protein n=1 Tax=Pseudomonas prosekii TaxID=1148509 RepID=UPI00387B1BA1